jgi:hypothetical protein
MAPVGGGVLGWYGAVRVPDRLSWAGNTVLFHTGASRSIRFGGGLAHPARRSCLAGGGASSDGFARYGELPAGTVVTTGTWVSKPLAEGCTGTEIAGSPAALTQPVNTAWHRGPTA